MRRFLSLLALVLCLLFHGAQVSSKWTEADQYVGAGDFASYYYAARVAERGGNPYRIGLLTREVVTDRAKGNGRAGPINPYFYPPPFVLLTSWVTHWDLQGAYRIWFWLDELAALGCVTVLGLWWRRLDPLLPVTTVAAFSLGSVVVSNHLIGQANFPTLFLVLLGLWLQERGRDHLAGALVGTACMLKMSPALFVAWWWLRWRWRPALTACATALALSVATLPVLGLQHQLHFYSRVLPNFAQGRYNGLKVPVTIFGNHSNPNVIHQLVSGSSQHIEPLTVELSRYVALALIVLLTTAFWREGRSRWREWGQLSAIGILMLLIPVYTYEHHTVWAIPAIALTLAAAVRGRLPQWLVPALFLAVAAWIAPLDRVRYLHRVLEDGGHTLAALAVQELKWAALWVLLVASSVLGASDPDTP